MDSSNSSSNPTKMQKIGRKRENDSEDVQEVDRISILPDGIHQHILGFLPTHYAVRTCVLSKRWKSTWMGIPVLNFHYMEMNRNNHFINFMENVLRLHDRTVLDTFRLDLALYFEVNPSDELDRLKAVLSEVLRREIQNLDVELFCVDFPFPSSLYECKTLTKLTLNGFKTTLMFPHTVCFPNLKYMKLRFVSITCKEGVEHVSFSCPALVEASFLDCVWYGIKSMVIFVPKLLWLTIEDVHDNNNTNCKIDIYAESLVSLMVFSCLKFKICFHNLLSLYAVSINIRDENANMDHVSKLIQAVSNVKMLTLENPTKLISKISSKKDLLAFSKLEVLILDMSGSMNGESLTEFFCSLLPLETLIFMEGIDKNSLGRYDWSIEAIPQSFLSHLRLFAINGFYGNETEISLVEFLVKNAKSINTISIASSPELSADRKKQLDVAKRLCNVYSSSRDLAHSFS